MESFINTYWQSIAYFSLFVTVIAFLIWSVTGTRKDFIEAHKQYIATIILVTAAPLVLWILNK